jgi:general secretion pathway protein H
MRRAFNNKGFTLIELMVVMAILGAMVTLAMPYMSSRNQKTKAFLRNFTVLCRDLHTKAKLHGVVYRIVLDLGEAGVSHPIHKYWVEKSNHRVTLSEHEEEEGVKRLAEKEEKDRKDPKGFELDPKFYKEPRELPPGLYFEKVELTRLREPIDHGKAYIHFMPEGLVDEAALQIKGEGTQAWTIAIHPLTGRAELISKVTTLKELKAQ